VGRKTVSGIVYIAKKGKEMQDRKASFKVRVARGKGQGVRYKNSFLLFVFRFWIEKDGFLFPDQVEDRFHGNDRDRRDACPTGMGIERDACPENNTWVVNTR